MMMAIAWNKLSHGQSLHISRCGYKFLQFETSCDAQAVHDLVLLNHTLSLVQCDCAGCGRAGARPQSVSGHGWPCAGYGKSRIPEARRRSRCAHSNAYVREDLARLRLSNSGGLAHRCIVSDRI